MDSKAGSNRARIGAAGLGAAVVLAGGAGVLSSITHAAPSESPSSATASPPTTRNLDPRLTSVWDGRTTVQADFPGRKNGGPHVSLGFENSGNHLYATAQLSGSNAKVVSAETQLHVGNKIFSPTEANGETAKFDLGTINEASNVKLDLAVTFGTTAPTTLSVALNLDSTGKVTAVQAGTATPEAGKVCSDNASLPGC